MLALPSVVMKIVLKVELEKKNKTSIGIEETVAKTFSVIYLFNGSINLRWKQLDIIKTQQV